MSQGGTVRGWTEDDRVRRGAKILVLVLILAAVTPFVLFAVPQVIGADEGFVVLSGSMEPALVPGDVVIVDGSASIAVGDVITYRTSAESLPRTHRVIDVVDGGFETKGDANENADHGIVPPEAVLGRVILVIPWVGHVILWANTPLGYVSLVVVPLVLLALNELLGWIRDEPAEPVPASEDSLADTWVPARPADGVESSTQTQGAATERGDKTIAVAVTDLKLTLLAMASLVAYAGWNIYREFVAIAAPNPISVAAFTGGLLGLLFAASVTTAAWRANRANRAAAQDAEAPAPARADGGDEEVDDDV